MDKKYVDNLTKSEEKLQHLKQEFSEYVKPNDQFVITIERLLAHIGQLLYMCLKFSNSVTPELLEASTVYFKLNIEGLEKVLDAIRNGSNKT